MNKSLAIAFLHLGMLALSANAVAAQPGGPPGLSGLLPRIDLVSRSIGTVPPPFVVPTVPAAIPSASRVAIPAANPVGTTLNPPGLLGTTLVAPTAPPARSADSAEVLPGENRSTEGNDAGLPDHLLLAGQPTIEPQHAGSAQLPGESDNLQNLPTCN